MNCKSIKKNSTSCYFWNVLNILKKERENKMNVKNALLSTAFGAVLTVSLINGVSAESKENSLSQNQKNKYYKQYSVIIDTVNKEHPEADLELVAKKDFKKADWVSPTRFKRIAEDRVGLTFEPSYNVAAKASVTKAKSKTINAKGTSVSIKITGSFDTVLRESAGRQFFSDVNWVKSADSTDKGVWSQTGYTPTLIDGGRTYDITVGGKYTQNGVSSTHNIPVEFYCSATGVVS